MVNDKELQKIQSWAYDNVCSISTYYEINNFLTEHLHYALCPLMV